MIIEYKGIPIFYEDEGKGRPIVLLHGFLENTTMWAGIKKELLDKCRVICVDLLGHGQTGCLGYVHTMSTMSEAVLAVIKDLKLKTFMLIGHSMGGYVALNLAKKIPASITGLCLMNSTYEADDIERRTIRERANIMAQTNYANLVRLSFMNLFSEESRMRYKVEMELALQEALNTPVQGYIAAQKGMMIRSDMFEFFKNLSAKKLIIIGANDPVVNSEQILNQTNNTNINCEVLSNGHMSYIEDKSELTYILLQFIE
ncbi:alpha/beta fold hydrolase [Psychroserpens sp. MEBiC05023]